MTTPEELPREVLDAEIATIVGLGIELRASTAVGDGELLEKGTVPRKTQANLRETAPVSAGGQSPFRDDPGTIAGETNAEDAVDRAEVDAGRSSPAVRRGAARLRKRCQGSRGGLGPETGRPRHPDRKRDVCHEPARRICRAMLSCAKGLVVRSVADGHEAAMAIGGYLAVGKAAGQPKPFSVRAGKMASEELTRWIAMGSSTSRQEPKEDATLLEAAAQSARCLHCDCRAVDTCKLRRYATEYGADWDRFRGGRTGSSSLSNTIT